MSFIKILARISGMRWLLMNLFSLSLSVIESIVHGFLLVTVYLHFYCRSSLIPYDLHLRCSVELLRMIRGICWISCLFDIMLLLEMRFSVCRMIWKAFFLGLTDSVSNFIQNSSYFTAFFFWFSLSEKRNVR